jgi:cyanophycinase
MRLAIAAAAILALASPANGASAGPLLAVGGGDIPDAIFARFIEMSGGAGKARIVVLPMSSEDPESGKWAVEALVKLGAQAERRNFTRAQAQAVPPEILDSYTGIWLGGGDQSRFMDVVSGTPLEAALLARHRAGVAIGGTSAGAALQTTPMITGDEKRPGGAKPLAKDSPHAWVTIDRDNVVTRGGLGLWDGVILDQHFVRRRRFQRLLSLVLEGPVRLGAGIDEATALETGPDGVWHVLGESVVVVIDAREAVPTATPAPLGASGVTLHVLPAGASFDPRSGRATLPASPGARAVAEAGHS